MHAHDNRKHIETEKGSGFSTLHLSVVVWQTRWSWGVREQAIKIWSLNKMFNLLLNILLWICNLHSVSQHLNNPPTSWFLFLTIIWISHQYVFSLLSSSILCLLSSTLRKSSWLTLVGRCLPCMSHFCRILTLYLAVCRIIVLSSNCLAVFKA